MKSGLTILTSLFLTACSPTTAIDVVNGCDWTRTITVSHKDTLTRETAEEIEYHNKARERICE